MPAESFLDRFAAVVARFPRAVAVAAPGDEIYRQRRITYAKLARRAKALASRLTKQAELRAGEVVALDLAPGIEMITAMLAVWHAGAAFMMLDRNHPPARRAAILAEAEPGLILTSNAAGRFIIETKAATPRPEAEPALAEFVDLVDSPSAPLAYIVFTSGTTGRPRGVAVSHTGIVPFLDAQIRAFALESGDRMLATLSPAFDAAQSEYGATLLSGATLVFAPDPMRNTPTAFGKLLRETEISHVCLPPALLTHWPARDMPETLRTVIIGGEAAPAAGVRDWARRFRLINVYGPSEATVCASLWRCDANYQLPYLGETVPGTSWRAVDPELADGIDLPVGATGELWLAGSGLAHGYWRDPELTKARFVVREGRRWYRTGDLVRRRSPGGPEQFEYLGRLDRQLQVRGNRVEALDLERRLAACPGALEARVRLSPRDGEVEAHIVRADGDAHLDAASLRASIRAALPEHCVPRHIYFHAQPFPRNSNGKVDEARSFRRGASDGGDNASDGEDIAPDCESPRERILSQVWAAIFGAAPASVHANFFQAGGTSFLLLRFLAGASAAGIQISPRQFYADPTIRGALLNGETITTNRLRAHARLDAKLKQRIRIQSANGAQASSGARRKIFVTGATGLLGSRIVREILTCTRRPAADEGESTGETNLEIICLVRDVEQARHRFSMQKHAPEIRAALDTQSLRFIQGDLVREGLGLLSRDREEIAESCDTILHCGARVHLTEHYEQLRAANLDASREILELASVGVAKRLHFVSTLSVAVATDWTAGVFFEGDRLENTSEVFGGYARSKWAAEYLFHSARAAGLRGLSIHRPGWLLPDAHSLRFQEQEQDRGGTGGQREDFLKRVIFALRTLGYAPASGPAVDSLRMDCTPVAYAARAIASLIVEPVSEMQSSEAESEAPAFHLATDEALGWPQFIAGVGALERIPVPAFLERLAQHSRDSCDTIAEAAGVIEAALGWRLRRTLHSARNHRKDTDGLRGCDLFAATHRWFDRKHTRRVLETRGIVCPSGAQAFAEYLRTMMEAGDQGAGIKYGNA